MRHLVGSTNQACSSGFYFRIAWKSMERPCFLQNHSLLLIFAGPQNRQKLTALKIKYEKFGPKILIPYWKKDIFNFFKNSKFVSSMRQNMNEIFNKMKIESTVHSVHTCFYLTISKSTTILSKLSGVLSVLFLKIGGLGTWFLMTGRKFFLESIFICR